MTEFEAYRKSALRDVLAYPSISDEHRHELESGDEQWEMTIATCYKQNVKPSVCALALYWQDQYNKWGQPDEIEAEGLAIRKLSELQNKYGFRL